MIELNELVEENACQLDTNVCVAWCTDGLLISTIFTEVNSNIRKFFKRK